MKYKVVLMDRGYEGLEKASGVLFAAGSVFAKLQYIPITFIRLGSNITALLMYLVGYVLWIAACQKYPHQKNLNQSWYTFAEFKDQFTTSAIIGSIAMVFSLLAIVNPIAFVVSAWLMVASNFFWVVGERNKMDNPPDYRQIPNIKYQETNFNYTTIVFSISVITALSVTTAVFLPISSVYVISLATILTTGLTLWSIEHTFENWFPEQPSSKELDRPQLVEVHPSLNKLKPNLSNQMANMSHKEIQSSEVLNEVLPRLATNKISTSSSEQIEKSSNLPKMI